MESVTNAHFDKYRKAVYVIGVFFVALLISDILGFTKFMVPAVSEKWWFPYWSDAVPMYKYALVYFFGAFSAGFKVHQGEIWVESEGEGKGSRFIVKLPLT